MTIEFGISLIPETAQWPRLASLAELADASGLDLVGIQDHPYNRRYLETATLLTFLAARTQRVRFFADVYNLGMRLPAMLAKHAATLDVLTGGRVELGLGAGGFNQAVVAMGGPERTVAESVSALEEAIHVVRAAWGTERGVRFEGRHYQLQGYQPGPQPVHRMGIWVGGYKPRMLDLIGRLADGWVVSLGRVEPGQLAGMQSAIDAAAERAGRRREDVRRIANVGGPTDDADAFADELARLCVEERLETFILWPSEPIEEQIARYAEEVVPRVRERTATTG